MAMALARSCGGKTLIRIDSVDGMMNAGADAHHAAAGDQLRHRRAERGDHRADEEDQQAELQRALAAEAVAERAGGEQQAGEHERVDGDHPLQLRFGRPELRRTGRAG